MWRREMSKGQQRLNDDVFSFASHSAVPLQETTFACSEIGLFLKISVNFLFMSSLAQTVTWFFNAEARCSPKQALLKIWSTFGSSSATLMSCSLCSWSIGLSDLANVVALSHTSNCQHKHAACHSNIQKHVCVISASPERLLRLSYCLSQGVLYSLVCCLEKCDVRLLTLE